MLMQLISILMIKIWVNTYISQHHMRYHRNAKSYATFDLSESGTIVKWSTLDRIDWAKSKTVVRNTSKYLDGFIENC